MARHRDIRNMNYYDEYDYDDYHGSEDEDYYESPNSREFIYNREIPENANTSHKDSDQAAQETDEIKLESCLEYINFILGPNNVPKDEIKSLILKYKFNNELVLNTLLENSNFSEKEEIKNKATSTTNTPTVIAHLPNAKSTNAAVTTNVVKGFNLPATNDIQKSASKSKLIETLKSDDGGGRCGQQVAVKSKKGKKVDPIIQYKNDRGDEKEHLQMVVIGHVDSGKSTLMGRLLCELGQVNKKVLHKYEQESKKIGKKSFMYAWVLDETGEERNRGITMDVGRSHFETKNRKITLLDAPGHRDFIPNMISGAAQADVALLVIDSIQGEFESGFDLGGQTREHALLVRSLGVTQLAVVINKLDSVGWSKTRFDEIVGRLKVFLKQIGFNENDVSYVPCSGLTGQNLVKPPTENGLLEWYNGPCLIDIIDKFVCPSRPITKPLRFTVNDFFKNPGSGFSVSGRVESGILNVGDKILVCPIKETALVKNLVLDENTKSAIFAGDNAVVALNGIEMQNISIGSVLCSLQNPIPVSNKFEARIVIFNIPLPITKGYSVVLHHQSLIESVIISKLISQINRSTGELVKKRPRFLSKNTSAIVEITVSRKIALELYSDCKELGRITLREGGKTIAAGLVTKIY